VGFEIKILGDKMKKEIFTQMSKKRKRIPSQLRREIQVANKIAESFSTKKRTKK